MTRIAIEGLTPRVQGFCTTRHRGASAKPYDSFNLGNHVGDSVASVMANRQQLSQWLPSAPIWVDQVHGTNVLVVDRSCNSETILSGLTQADALVTTTPKQPLGILTADCMSVVIANGTGTVLGLAHAGWRGLAAGVLQATVKTMREQNGELGAWRAWIGPCIGMQAFEVGSEVREAFLAKDPELAKCFVPHGALHKWLCDLPGIARKILHDHGASSVVWCGLCTVNDPANRFFSYRRDGQTGRMATVAWIT
ncbi:peptidoglycan editing factor PgeF [Orrella daihaiensis]|uniref:Purine nucleoside phosphorylase n=1 Tax=Orrella daihaiensis TaxID=2782176 RepID=A0ABY4ANL5_9BURK|nr:peptidoglycan editing factor PgeF [Orrella daihaiensis]UOD49639.1 peptidoglycan editing factor PgeF [Orrella daihaiensis]